MSNKPGPQPKIKHCPICKSKLKNVPRKQMKSRYRRRDGTVALHTHTYDCLICGTRFEINQDRRGKGDGSIFEYKNLPNGKKN